MQNKTDEIIREIADYVLNSKIESDEAFKIAHYNVLDALGCGIFALQFPACTRLLGPIVPNVKIENGVGKLEFFTADKSANYVIIVEGISNKGRICYGTQSLSFSGK